MKGNIFENACLKIVCKLSLLLLSLLMISCTTINKSYLENDRNSFTIQYQEKDSEMAIKILNLLENNSENIVNDVGGHDIPPVFAF